MTLDQVKKSVDAGLNVYYRNVDNQVIKDEKGRYVIRYLGGQALFGIEGQNIKAEHFFGAKVR